MGKAVGIDLGTTYSAVAYVDEFGKPIIRPFILSLALTATGVAHAQPNAENGAGAQNPPNQERAGRGGRALTPEQRQQIQAQAQQRRELSVRAALTTAGFTEAALQDAVVAYSTEKEKATQALQGKARTLTQAMRTTTTTDAQIAALLNDFRAAVEEEKAQRATAQTALAAQIGLATKPRLDALLMMMGLTGDEAQYLGSGRGFGGGNGRGNGRGDRGGAQN
jgi:hypothetical protein